MIGCLGHRALTVAFVVAVAGCGSGGGKTDGGSGAGDGAAGAGGGAAGRGGNGGGAAGAAGRGGAGGGGGAAAGAGGRGGVAGGTAGAAGGTAGGGGGEACGPSTCGANQVCCNASCGICTAPGEGCIKIACPADAGIVTDARACVAVPERDEEVCGGDANLPPHAYTCVGPQLGTPCVLRSSVTNTFCCRSAP